MALRERPECYPLHSKRHHGHDQNSGQRHHQVGLACQAIKRKSADHDQFAMGKIDQAHNAENQANSQCGEGIDSAKGEMASMAFWRKIMGPPAGSSMPK